MRRDLVFCNLIMGLAIVILFGVLACGMGYFESCYVREDCEVVNVEDNTVWVVDKTDNLWMFDVEENIFEVGEIVDLKMNTNHTESNIFDDIILEVEK